MLASIPFALLFLTLAAVVSAAAAIYFVSSPAVSRRIIPFSGGVLMGIALAWVLPEIGEHLGWTRGAAALAAGVLALLLIDRYVHPLCPACSHTHDHDACHERLHGFAAPLVLAFSVHSFLDGLAVPVSLESASLGPAFVGGIALHKIPEGLALGAILRAALPSRGRALAWAAAAQGATIAGGLAEAALQPLMSPGWTMFLLSLAGGSFLYLGFHAVHGEWRRRGVPAFVPALTGIAGAAAIQIYRFAH